MAAVLLFVAVGIAGAQTIRIGSSAPENSPWGRALNRLAVEWQQISNGRVRVQVFHNNIAGVEADVIRKMRIGQLQAAVITNAALAAFSDQIMTLSMPLLIRSEDEFNYVFERVRPQIEADIADDGFQVVSWSLAGWVYPFSDEPVRTPDDLRALRLAASPEEQDLIRAYQILGFQPVSISFPERLAGLVNNMADAHLTVPILAASFQWFGATDNMTNIKIAPAPGAIIMSERAYRRLPAQYRDEMLAAANRISAGLNGEIDQLEQEALETMTEFGLTIVEPTAEEEAEWFEEFEGAYDVMLGTVFDESMYREIQEILDEYRQ
jgi:TRAP-type C4-dicarboxylate transport system substrate-binding protein